MELQEAQDSQQAKHESAPISVAADLAPYVRAVIESQQPACRQTSYDNDASESLAIMALKHEHENRRRFLASAGPPGALRAGGASNLSGSTSASAASASAREAASIRHRLLHTLPELLLRQDRTASVALLLYKPPPPSTSLQLPSHPSSSVIGKRSIPLASGSSAPSSISHHHAESLRMMIQEGLTGVRWSRWSHPGLALRTWQRFFIRCIEANGGRSEGLWSEIARLWGPDAPETATTNGPRSLDTHPSHPGGGRGPSVPSTPAPTAALEAIPLAVAALCAATEEAGSGGAAGPRVEWALGRALEHLNLQGSNR